MANCRPVILYIAVPTAILGTDFVMMPYEKMTLIIKCIVKLAYNIGFQLFFNFLNNSSKAYTSIRKRLGVIL